MAMSSEGPGLELAVRHNRRGRSVWHGWTALVFSPASDDQRRRRGTDGVRALSAVAALVCCLLIIRHGYRVDHAITRVVYPPPESLSWLITAVYYGGVFGITAILALIGIGARRWAVLRDMGVSVLGTLLVSGLLILVFGATGGRGNGAVIEGFSLDFPVLQIALFMAVATSVLPYLARSLQRFVEVAAVFVALACVVGGHGLPVSVLGSLAIGWGLTAVVRLAFGSPLGLPSASDVQLLLGELGIQTSHVWLAKRQEWGVASYRAREDCAPPSDSDLAVGVYGRDAADARILSKAGRFVLYRDSGPTLTLTRLQQVEREAYVTLRATQIGVRAPVLVEAGKAGPSGDALVVCRPPRGVPFSEINDSDVDDAACDALFAQLLLMRHARFSHGEINRDAVALDPESGAVGFVNLRSATTNSAQFRLDRDAACGIAVLCLCVGAQRAAQAAARCLPSDVLEVALQHLRRASLDPRLARELRGKQRVLDEVRHLAAEAKGIQPPELIEPRRVSWTTLILVIGSLVGGWALLGVLIDVAQSFDTIVGANWLWVVAAALLAQLGYAGTAVEDLGSVVGDLPFIRVLALEIANAFSGIAGGTAAVFATRTRFLQQQGYDASVAVGSSGIITATSWLVKGALFVISLPLAWGTLHLEATPEQGSSAKTLWILLTVIILVGVAVGLVMTLPRLRRFANDRLRPRARDMWANARTVSTSPRKMTQLFGGAIVNQLAVALALSSSLRAFDDHLSLATLIIVITLASVLGGISPVPGGVGIVEAGMILGLTAAGISESDATAAVFVQRLFTSYLPPLWGWFALLWLRRRDFV